MGNAYNFEEFTSFKGKFASKISLVKTGGFGFSAGFFNANDLNDSVAIKLFYDKDKMVVGFKFLNEQESGSAKLKNRKDSGGYVSAISFLNKYVIDKNKYAGRYEPRELMDDKLGKIFIIELREKK